MGSPLSPVLANIYMEYFEKMALGSTSLKPSMWLRYVDDTFVLWPHQEDVQKFLDPVSSIRPSIQFTKEKKQVLQQQLGLKIKDTSLVLMKMYTFICALVQRKKQAYTFSNYTFSNVKSETKQMHS